ncbi:MAG: hypothetical protein M3R70_01405 [Actinomycetota bacterium]|nr:hypothetical protein [Actinomycetota bacterium]
MMQADGRGEKHIGSGWEPTWAPDGRTLAFTEYGDLDFFDSRLDPRDRILIAAADGTGTSRQLALGVQPAWSPEGSRIVFVHYEFRDGEPFRSTLKVMRPDGTGERTVTSTSYDKGEPLLYAPAWSPDGHTIAVGSSGDDGDSLREVDPDTGATRSIVKAGEEGLGFAWSRDGRQIALFTPSEIRLVDSDGTNSHTLVRESGGYWYPEAVWSPDSTQIAYIRFRYPRSGDGLSAADVYTVHTDGTARRRVTRTVGSVRKVFVS